MALILPLSLTFVLQIAACILNGRSLTVELEERLSDYKRMRQVSDPIATLCCLVDSPLLVGHGLSVLLPFPHEFC